MMIRFEKVDFLDNSTNFDYDNAEYLCCIDHKDYTEYTKLLYFIKDQSDNREFGNIDLIYDNEQGKKVTETYSIADIILSVPKGSKDGYAESIKVYVYEN